MHSLSVVADSELMYQHEASTALNQSDQTHQESRTKLNAQYFEQKLLEPEQRSVEWLMEQLRPQGSLPDRLLAHSITENDYS